MCESQWAAPNVSTCGYADVTKDGLQSALEFTRYLTAISAGGVAFLLEKGALEGHLANWQRYAVTIIVISLAVSVISGLTVLSRGAVMLAHGEHSLDDKLIRIPGIANLAGFAFGFLCLGCLVVLRVWS